MGVLPSDSAAVGSEPFGIRDDRKDAYVSDNTLVIVESPAKAKKIAGYLGDDYTVLASVGHVRDLASKASEIPAEDRKKPWAKLAVNVDDAFQAYYVVHDSKKATIKELKAALKEADELLLATDEDREGEAISWHLLEVLKPKVPVKRMVFNEITPEAIREAVNRPRELDMRLVEAQETRRVVDRLYGYPVSEVLWKKVGREAKIGRTCPIGSRSPSWWTASESASLSRRWSIGASTRSFFPARSRGGWRQSVGRGSQRGRTSTTDGRLSREGAVHLDEASAQGPDVGARWTGLHGRLGDAEAFLPKAEGTVHDLNASAGSLRSPSVGVPNGPCGSHSPSTRTATSPTCEPTPPRCLSRR